MTLDTSARRASLFIIPCHSEDSGSIVITEATESSILQQKSGFQQSHPVSAISER